MIDEIGGTATALRPVLFARHARAALEKHVPEARTPAAHWHLGTNEAWVRYPRHDGLHGYFGLRRHLDWVSAEAGVSREPTSLADLFRLPGHPRGDVVGYRIRLGDLIDGKDRWWPTGETPSQMDERLGQLALQLAVKGRKFFRRWPGVGR
ncbi:MAG: hypothetical protein ACRENJ_09005 [Candidatus Eiseniibacteriota bacterium]